MKQWLKISQALIEACTTKLPIAIMRTNRWHSQLSTWTNDTEMMHVMPHIIQWTNDGLSAQALTIDIRF